MPPDLPAGRFRPSILETTLMNARPAAPYRRGIGYISAAAISWGLGGAVAAGLFRGAGLGPLAVSFWRFAIATGLLLLPSGRISVAGVTASGPTPSIDEVAVRRGDSAVKGARGRNRLTKRLVIRRAGPISSVRATLLTGVGLAVYQAAYFGSVRYAGLALGTLVTLGASPLLVGVAAHYVLGERLSRRALGAVGLAVTGLALTVSGPAAGPRPGLGIALAVVSAIGYCALTLAARRGWSADLGVGTWAAGMLALLPFAAVQGVWPRTTHASTTLGALLFLGLVPTVLAYRWYFAGLTVVPSAVAAVIVLLEPVTAALIGVLAFGESLAPMVIGGAVLLLTAIVVLTREVR
jgi:drug/metabolite transporter, DME family